MPEIDSTIGKTQAMILALLWSNEMYGLEIQQILHLKGIKVSKSQLYQALNKLEQKNFLKSRIEVLPGANRKFYTITEGGKAETKLFIQPIFNIVSELLYDVFDEIIDYVSTILPKDPEIHILEISESNLPMFLNYFSQILSKRGKFDIYLHSPEMKEMIFERIKSIEMEEIASIVESNKNKLTLSENSIDFILIPFYLHNDGTEWVLGEATRVLKKGGSILIFDVEEMAENLLADSLFKLLTHHSRYGVNSNELKKNLSKNYSFLHFSIFKGIFFLKAKKN
jgi:DNA-binding PadR family transcriptional regulator